MCETTDDSREIRFQKKVEKLKIPQNIDVLPAKNEKMIEFILEIE